MVELKSLPAYDEAHQLRLGLGQVLNYRYSLANREMRERLALALTIVLESHQMPRQGRASHPGVREACTRAHDCRYTRRTGLRDPLRMDETSLLQLISSYDPEHVANASVLARRLHRGSILSRIHIHPDLGADGSGLSDASIDNRS